MTHLPLCIAGGDVVAQLEYVGCRIHAQGVRFAKSRVDPDA
jgi:hypothetical protein